MTVPQVVVGHVAGVPIEELLLPLLSMGGAMVVALRAEVASRRPRRR